VAFVAGLIAFIPFPVLVLGYILPAIAWLALVGLAVPAAVMEGTGVLASLKRGVKLGTADYIHSLGGMAALAIAFYLSTRVLALALNAGSGQAAEIAREPPLLRPGRPSRVGPSAIEEEPRCPPTSC
jgi:hypothetical protein